MFERRARGHQRESRGQSEALPLLVWDIRLDATASLPALPLSLRAVASSRRLPRVRRDGYRRGHVHVERSNAPPLRDHHALVQRGQHVRVHPLPFASEHERRLRRPFEIVQRHRPPRLFQTHQRVPLPSKTFEVRAEPVDRHLSNGKPPLGGDADAGEISARDDARIRQRERLRAEHLARSRQTRQVRNLIHQ